MQSAPAHIPAITVASFGAGFAAPDLIRGAVIETFSANIAGSPVCSASVITGTSPAYDTRLSSSNTADRRRTYATLAPEVPFLNRADCA